MSWARLDDTFYDNPKVDRAGLAAAGLYAKSLSFCGRHLTDGHIPTSFVRAHGTKTAATRLVEVGLWAPNGDGWEIHDYHDFNPSREEVIQERERISKLRSEAGKKGAMARWQRR